MITAITPTGDRPEALRLASIWMGRQTYDGPVQWIVVDDGHKPNPAPWVQDGWEVEYVRRDPEFSGTPASLASNVLAALPLVKSDLVVMVEDDDYYRPHHLETMEFKLNGAMAAGDGMQRYYHVPSRRYVEMVNRGSSLAQTAFRMDVAKTMEEACNYAIERGSKGVDARFWGLLMKRKVPVNIYDDPVTVAGIKGLPGRPGLGIGHRPDDHQTYPWREDPDLEKLLEWTGTGAMEIIRTCRNP